MKTYRLQKTRRDIRIAPKPAPCWNGWNASQRSDEERVEVLCLELQIETTPPETLAHPARGRLLHNYGGSRTMIEP
eukprot:6884868-Pyramimonas_sp.AAC.1